MFLEPIKFKYKKNCLINTVLKVKIKVRMTGLFLFAM